MAHQLRPLATRDVTKPRNVSPHSFRVDVCVVGAGIAGLSAAIESARLGRSIVLVDSLPVLGGQMVNSIIGVFCGVFGNAPDYRQLTHGIFDDIFRDLVPGGDVYFSDRQTKLAGYDEVVLGRWVEETIRGHDIDVITGATLLAVEQDAGRIASIQFATRYGPISVAADGFVDASGDAALCWEAGLPCRLPERTIYGTQQVVVENVNGSRKPDRVDFSARFAEKAAEYDLPRRDGIAVFFPGRDTAVLNMTHIEAPLDPVNAARAQLDGRAQADRAVALLRAEFPQAFGEARVRAYGLPGRRQTRWVRAVHQLTVDEIREGVRFPDAVARTAWPIELHDDPTGYVWETFDFSPDHVHYVPLRAMTPPDVHNLVVAGRCIDGDAAALSSVRVMGPCAAMGMGAAHALDMAGAGGSVHQLDYDELAARLSVNLDD